MSSQLKLDRISGHELSMLHYSVTSLLDGEKAIEQIDQEKFDLYIIDINIPSVNGLELVKYIRQKDLTAPIVIITASLEFENFKMAFEHGCSEYIKKPFYLEELKIRINNLIEKSKNDAKIEIANNITYNLEYEELVIDKEVVRLRKKERRLLTLLLQNVNKTVPLQTIEDYVWENEIKESYPLRQLVAELRKKFNTGQKFIFVEKISNPTCKPLH